MDEGDVDLFKLDEDEVDEDDDNKILFVFKSALLLIFDNLLWTIYFLLKTIDEYRLD